MKKEALISIIIPIYNEASNIPDFFVALQKILSGLSGHRFEIVFINDGSRDNSLLELEKLVRKEDDDSPISVEILDFSRNFGKEAALSAGLRAAKGEAALMIDADFQHTIELIPEFIKKWEDGAEVVIGVRETNKKASLLKRAGSFVFYKIIRNISNVEMRPSETDFRIIDRVVIDEFNKLSERNRMTRGLINWLGFKREYITFCANERADGHAGYSLKKLTSLALNSFVSLSLLPLKLAGYLGLIIIFTVGPFGLYILLGKYFFHSAFATSFSGPAQLAFLLTFLVGTILISLGLVSLYIAHIHDEVLGRPLYIVRKKNNL